MTLVGNHVNIYSKLQYTAYGHTGACALRCATPQRKSFLETRQVDNADTTTRQLKHISLQ